jgi:hypothetical protein
MPLFPRPVIDRIGVRPDQPDPFAVPRPRGSRRPHSDAKVAQVRRLVEGSALTYGEIAARTGVGRASICRWTRDGQWRRHPFAPRATDTVPGARAGARLRLRTLFARLAAQAERAIRELEESATVDLDRLAEAMELLKVTKAAARPRRRRRKPGDPADSDFSAVTGERLRPVMQLCYADVDLHRAPRAAVDDFLAHREPPAVKPPPFRRSRRARREREHAWMMEKEE